MPAITICSDFGAPKNKVCHHCFPIYLPWSDGTGYHDLSFLNAEFSLDHILKSRDITLPTKVCLVKTMVFPVVMNGCESWTVKKAECWRIDAFELWCWRRLLRVPWTARRSVLGVLGRNDAKAETPILWPPHEKSWLIGKDPDAGKDWRQEEKGMTEVEMVR